jgi:hypothetical protein
LNRKLKEHDEAGQSRKSVLNRKLNVKENPSLTRMNPDWLESRSLISSKEQVGIINAYKYFIQFHFLRNSANIL